MEAFVSRKRRRLSLTLGAERQATSGEVQRESVGEDDSTELKLAVLASLHPFVDPNLLLDVLLANDGSVQEASQALANPQGRPSSRQKPASMTYQSSLSTFANSVSEATHFGDGRSKALTRKGRTLHVYSPEDIAAHTPCSIIHNFLPAAEADDLLEELLKEAPSFKSQTFKLFDNFVQSPHTACFFVRDVEEEKRQKTEYLYNGAYLTVTPHSTSDLAFAIDGMA